MRLRTSAMLASLALVAAVASCESLYGGYGIDNPDNCTHNDVLCSASEACNTVSKLCEPAIVLESVTPALALNRGGATVTLKGKLLSPDLTVLFDGMPATVMPVTPVGDGDSLSVVVPADPGKKGPVRIEVVHPAGQRQQREGLFSYYSAIQFQDTKSDGPLGPAALVGGDLNRDGKPDFVICEGSSNDLEFYPGNGDGTFGTVKATALDLSPTSCAIGDVNGDGKLDIIAISRQPSLQQVALGDGSGGFAMQAATATPRQFGEVQLVDMNGDHLDDVVVADAPGVSVEISDGQGGFASSNQFKVFNNASSILGIAVADLNGDGKPDVLYGNAQDSAFALLFGDGTGMLGNGQMVAMPKAPKRVTIADINRDGNADILGSCNGDTQIEAALGTPGGTFEVGQFYNLPKTSQLTALYVRDLNGDDLGDLIWFSLTANTNFGNFVGLGDSNFVDAQGTSLGLAPNGWALQDWNGDKKLDAVVAERSIMGTKPGVIHILMNTSE